MGMLYEPEVHRCSPPSSALHREIGSWWRCDECGALWEYVVGDWGGRWKYRRPTKRVLRKIARLTGVEVSELAAMLKEEG